MHFDTLQTTSKVGYRSYAKKISFLQSARVRGHGQIAAIETHL